MVIPKSYSGLRIYITKICTFVDITCVTASLFMTCFYRFCVSYTVGQTISSLSGWALVGRLFFRHFLVVEPSPPLCLSASMWRLAADYPLLDFPAIHPILHYVRQLMLSPIEEPNSSSCHLQRQALVLAILQRPLSWSAFSH